MIYYPLGVLMLAGIRDILVISTPSDVPRFEALLGDGSRLRNPALLCRAGTAPRTCRRVHRRPRVRRRAIRVALILGDNIFYGAGLIELVRGAAVTNKAERPFSLMRSKTRSATASSSSIAETRSAISIEEKPARAEIELGGHRSLFLRQRTFSTSPRRCSRPRAASSRSPTSTARISTAGNLRVARLGRGLPGSTPARTTASTTPARSCGRSRNGRA